MVSQPMRRIIYRPDIDGLRALAVLAIVLYHAGLGFPGGYIGVDVFFVISGYLITGLIIQEIEQSKFSLTNFWERRIRRLLPASFLMIVVTLAMGYVLFLPSQFTELAKAALAQSLIISNIYFRCPLQDPALHHHPLQVSR